MADVTRISAALSLDGLGDQARAAFDLAAQAGYAGVSIPSNHPEIGPAALSDTGLRHLKKTLDSQRLAIAAVRIAGPRAGLADPATIDRMMAHAQAGMQWAHALGVPVVGLHIGSLREVATSAAYASILSAARTLANEADKAGLTLALSADDLGNLRGLLDTLAFDHAQANFDPASALGAGEDPEAAAQRLLGRIGQMTADDATGGARGTSQRVELGQGQVPVRELLAMLESTGFHGPVIVDVRHLPNAPHAAQAAADYLRQLRRD